MPRFLTVLAHELTTLPVNHPDRPRKLRELRVELPEAELNELAELVKFGPILGFYRPRQTLIELNLATEIVGSRGITPYTAATPLGLAVLRAAL